jgi:tetratricopeptide (TPR) repeat protein
MRVDPMTVSVPKIDAAYREYADLLFRHHVILVRGRQGGEEMDSVEDEMSAIWAKLDEAQRQSLRGLSSDLNWILRRGGPPPNEQPRRPVTNAELRELQAAQEAGDWHATLHLLRMYAYAIRPDFAAYIKATCYYKLEFPGVALAATDLTVELARHQSEVARFAFEALMRLAPGIAFARANEILRQAGIYPPVVVAQAIGHVYDTMGGAGASLDLDILAGILRDATSRLESSKPSIADRVLFFQLAGRAMGAFGHVEESRALFEEGLRYAPEDWVILVGLGKAVQETDEVRAIALYRRAAGLKAPVLRPYLQLAHYHLVRHEYGEAYAYAEQGKDFAYDDRAKAVILEIMAICASELAHPAESIRKLFNEAVRLDPHTSRIAANLKTFEASKGNKGDVYQFDYSKYPPNSGARKVTVMDATKEPEFAMCKN